MDTKAFVKQIKARNRASNAYVFVSVMSGVGTTLLTVLLVHLLFAGELTRERIWQIGAGITVLQISKAVFNAVGIRQAHRAAYKSLTDLRLGIIGHLKKLPLGFFQKRMAGDLANIVSHDVEQIEVYLAHTQPEIIATTLAAAVIAALMLVVDWRLALCLLVPVAVSLMLLALLFKLWGGLLARYNRATKEMAENLMEYTATIPMLKAFSKSERKGDALIAYIKSYVKAMRRMILGVSAPQGVVTTVLQSGVFLVILCGIYLLPGGSLSVTRFILCLVLSVAFAAAMLKYMSYEHAGILLDRSAGNIMSVMGEEAVGEPGCAVLENGDIVFENVSFGYDGRECVLKNVSVTFRKGETAAIVGASGSGKSTMANLIMGFWKADSGRVAIGGKSVADAGEKDLTKIISIVQQESFLFNTSIADNIAIGRQGASREDIAEAAKRACIHDMISGLPDGYDTVVGEGGAKLSGGEKQCVAIARVMLKNAPVIILDEATASVDPESEHLIQEAITNMSRGKTLIVIAHRLSAIRGADQIIVMDGGGVTASGKHETLIENCPLYAEMSAAQEAVDTWEIRSESDHGEGV
ncbi:MAG: ABC transporter ATP-binding protein/permease [Treponema sp.]|jgi:ATP-binding cassette subfamily B protein|nr:ABC transporter ATP-binding protein/permease [Treponema sp.]